MSGILSKYAYNEVVPDFDAPTMKKLGHTSYHSNRISILDV